MRWRRALSWIAVIVFVILPVTIISDVIIHEHLHGLAYFALTGRSGSVVYLPRTTSDLAHFAGAGPDTYSPFVYWAPWLEVFFAAWVFAIALRRRSHPLLTVSLGVWFAVAWLTQFFGWVIWRVGDGEYMAYYTHIAGRYMGIVCSAVALIPLWTALMYRRRQRGRRYVVTVTPESPIEPAIASPPKAPAPSPFAGFVPLLVVLGIVASPMFYYRVGYQDLWQEYAWNRDAKGLSAAMHRSDYAAAEVKAKQVVARGRQFGTDSIRYVYSLDYMAALLVRESEYRRAEPVLIEARKLWSKQGGDVTGARARSLCELGDLQGYTGRLRECVETDSAAAALIDGDTLPRDRHDRDHVLSSLAWAQTRRGNYGEALAYNNKQLALLSKRDAPKGMDAVRILHNAAGIDRALGRNAEAARLEARALETQKKAEPANRESEAGILVGLGRAYIGQQKYRDAAAVLKTALAIREQKLGRTDHQVATAANALARADSGIGRYNDAEKLYARAMAIEKARLDPDNPDTAESLCGMGLLRTAQKRYGEAESYLDRALAMERRIMLPVHSEIARTLEAKADLARKMGHAGEAATYAGQAKAMRARIAKMVPR